MPEKKVSVSRETSSVSARRMAADGRRMELSPARRAHLQKITFFENPERAYRVRRPHFLPPACLTMAVIFSGCLVQFAHFWSEIALSSARGAHRSKMGLRKRPIFDPFRPPFLELSRETSRHFELKAPSRVEELSFLSKSENGALVHARRSFSNKNRSFFG